MKVYRAFRRGDGQIAGLERDEGVTILNRKNALLAGHDEGGKAWGRIASLIEIAKINGIEPFAYLKATLEAIAGGNPNDRLDELMPWNWARTSS